MPRFKRTAVKARRYLSYLAVFLTGSFASGFSLHFWDHLQDKALQQAADVAADKAIALFWTATNDTEKSTTAPTQSLPLTTGSINEHADVEAQRPQGRCVPGKSLNALTTLLQTLPESERQNDFNRWFGGAAICADGWSGKAFDNSQKDENSGAWVTPMSFGVELHTRSTEITAKQRVRYVGHLSGVTKDGKIIVTDGIIVKVLPPSRPDPVLTAKPDFWSGFTGGAQPGNAKESAR
jgi:hypothetical protein